MRGEYKKRGSAAAKQRRAKKRGVSPKPIQTERQRENDASIKWEGGNELAKEINEKKGERIIGCVMYAPCCWVVILFIWGIKNIERVN